MNEACTCKSPATQECECCEESLCETCVKLDIEGVPLCKGCYDDLNSWGLDVFGI